MDAKQQAAFDRLMAAAKEYNDLCPAKPEPSEPPTIEPKRFWALPGVFHLGVNAYLDCWVAPSQGKIPVLVLPLRPEDVEGYITTASVRAKVKDKLKAIGIEAVPLHGPRIRR